MTASSSALDLAALSRKELQALAKEFQLCRGNAKSDVILQYVQQFVAENPADGEARVRAALGETGGESASAASEPLSASPRTESPHEVVTTKAPNATTTTASPVAEKKKSVVTPSKDTSAPAAKKQQTPELKKSPGKSASTPSASPVPAKKATSSPAPAAKKSPAKVKADATPPSKAPVPKQTPPTTAAPKSPITKASESAKSVVKRSNNATPSPHQQKQQPKARLPAPNTTIEALVSAADDLAFIGDGSRVRCATTGHEMQADVAVVTAHVHGKRYARAQLQRQSFASFAPMFTPHPDEKKTAQLLWCHVTETEHPRDVARVKAHMAGVRYQKELPRWQADEAARVQAEREAAARAAAKAQARAVKRQQLEADAAGGKPRKGAAKKKSVKRSREEATGAVDKKAKKATEKKDKKEEDVAVVEVAEEHKPEAKRRRKRKHARKL